MKTTHDALTTLKGELEFLNQGGYRKPIGRRQPLFCMETAADWKKPLFFEDSPSCPKERHSACNPEGDCVLMGLVPTDERLQAVPCRHIPLNEAGETIDGLEKNGDREKIEAALRGWLTRNIEKLEHSAPH